MPDHGGIVRSGNVAWARTTRGFTLLEAVVALVLLATAGLALFSWINTSLDGLSRVESASRRIADERNALEYLRTINPMDRPVGETRLLDLVVKWRSTPLQSPVPNLTDAQTSGAFMVALYETELTLVPGPGNQRSPWSFTTRQFGYKRADAVTSSAGSVTKKDAIQHNVASKPATSVK